MGLNLVTARILERDGISTAGSGFLFSGRYLMTCAHVVLFALGLKTNTQEVPTGEISLEFPCLDDGSEDNDEIRIYKAKVVKEGWHPTVVPRKVLKDVAVLELIGDSPDILNPVGNLVKFKTLTREQLIGRKIAAFGFPKGNVDGENAYGEVVDISGRGLVEIDGEQRGSKIKQGFSGTAIFDRENKVILGIAKRVNADDPNAKVALMIPTRLLLRAWEPLASYCESNTVEDLLDILQTQQPMEALIAQLYFSILKDKGVLPRVAGDDSLNTLEKQLDDLSKRSELQTLVLQLKAIKASDTDFCEQLETWLTKYFPSSVDTKKGKGGKGKDSLKIVRKPALFLKFERSTPLPGQSKKSVVAKAWLIQDIDQYHRHNCAEKTYFIGETDIDLACKKSMTAYVNSVSRQCHSYLAQTEEETICIQRIYFSFPTIASLYQKSKLCHLDAWLKESFSGLCIGEKCPIILNLEEEQDNLAKNPEFIQTAILRRAKSKLVSQSLDDPTTALIEVLPHTPVKQFKLNIYPESRAAIAFEKYLTSQKREEVIFETLKAGLIIVVWTKKNCDRLKRNSRKALEELFEDCLLKDLPQAIYEARRDACDAQTEEHCEHIGKNVVILWNLPKPTNHLQLPKPA
ncbi:hypothetical protein Lepto7376_3806 [[Leptolyngbya] sp. PCC 7376]|uniref:trypsin-like peptidase domain-containing protein n=1 Tax=[Leptolyngbya] sp. PCC 7376 TaxID=111781 RepID=UPI00029F0583|nr:trypsin-like peptidase domain-containing protein [[Leptolyngbya] sp. PCC 7376]AFY39967.1 hypothetical protein Lepto7376_3806 [[Leptolyngbya] sp. PCC 7376]